MRFRALVCAAVLTLAPFTSQAATVTIDFGDAGLPDQVTSDFGDFTLTASGGDTLLTYSLNGVGVAGSGLSFVNNGEALIFAFAAAVTDVAVRVSAVQGLEGEPLGQRLVSIFDGGGLLGAFAQDGTGLFDLSALVAGAPITAIIMTAGTDSGFIVREITYTTESDQPTVIPLPASALLLGGALVMLGAARRRTVQRRPALRASSPGSRAARSGHRC